MSYIVLARKYRPQTFAEVYAQEHITEILHNAILSGRIAHAYLFTGPRGVGKTSMARILAKNLNCQEGPTVTPCNKCHNCLEITAGTSTDVIEIDGASNTGVEDIRELQRELIYAPSQSKYKIYIIDEVHMLSKNAFNALLKTLEEPPENVFFIFATTEPHKVLPTIISRCQRYDFKRIPIDAIVNRLKELMREEKIETDAESLHMVARKADGSLRDALSLMDQVLSYSLNQVTVDKVREIFGIIPTQVFCNILKLIKAGDAPNLLDELQRVFEQGTDLQELINGMMEFIRIVLLRKLGMSPLEVTTDEYPTYDEVAALFTQNNLLYIISFLTQTRNEIRTSANPYLVFEMLMIKLCHLDELNDIASVLSRMNTQESSTPAQRPATTANSAPQSRPASEPAKTPPRQVEPVLVQLLDITEANIEKMWDKVISRAKYLSTTTGLALAAAKWELTLPNKLIVKTSSAAHHTALQSKKDDIRKILIEYFGVQIMLEFELLAGEAPTRVDIVRKSIDDLKQLDPNLAKYIEITDSKISPQ